MSSSPLPNRPSLDSYFSNLLQVIKTRATCSRGQRAAIITDGKGRILGTGYNGVPSGSTHCIDVKCLGAQDARGDNTRCLAIHAETNAIMSAGANIDKATRIYVTHTPCFNCAKLILNTGIMEVVAVEEYPDQTGTWLLRENGRKVRIL